MGCAHGGLDWPDETSLLGLYVPYACDTLNVSQMDIFCSFPSHEQMGWDGKTLVVGAPGKLRPFNDDNRLHWVLKDVNILLCID